MKATDPKGVWSLEKPWENTHLAKINTVHLCLLQRPLKAMKQVTPLTSLGIQFSWLGELVLFLNLSCQASLRLRGQVSTDCCWQNLLSKGTAQVQTVKERRFGMEVALNSQFEIFCLRYRLPHNVIVIHCFSFPLCDFLIYMFVFSSMY